MSVPSPDPSNVSVIIPTYNRADLLPDALDSVLAQGPVVTEIIVVDDGSTDATLQVLAGFTDPRLKVVRQANQGAAAARQHGWRVCTGDWIVFLDSDDALEPGSIELLLAAAKKSPAAVVYAKTSIHLGGVNAPPALVLSFAEHSGDVLRDLCFFTGGTIFSGIFSREVLKAVGGFAPEPTDSASPDLDFAVRLAVKFPFVFLPAVTYRTRNHPGNTYKDREFQKRIFLCSQEVVRRRVPCRPSFWLLRQRSQANYLGLAASIDEELGRFGQAAKGYARSLLLWPVKLGAWKGLARNLGRPAGGAA